MKKTQKKVAHQISYGSRSLQNFLRTNQSKKISPVSKVRTFGFELLTKIKDPGLWNMKKIFRPIWKKNTFLKSARKADFRNVIFFEIRRKKFSKFFLQTQRPGSLIFVKSSKPKVRTFEMGEIFCLRFGHKKFSRLFEP